MLNDGGPWRDDFLMEYWRVFPIVPTYNGVRTARWKYVRYEPPPIVFEELYDLDADPYEMQNLASDPAYADVVTELSARLDELRSQ